MQFSEVFSIKRGKSDDWFDPILSLDTQLFIDPFLLYAQEKGLFKGSHKQVIAFFNDMFSLIARSGGDKGSVHYKKAVRSMFFPEVEELCLGYTRGGTRGSGTGEDLARLTADALWEAINAGVKEITHFEEIGVIREGIGPDRISDITAGLLRSRLIEYTQHYCLDRNIPVSQVRYIRGRYDIQTHTWIPIEGKLPANRYNKRPILLVPQRYLRALPTINPDDFWRYCYTNNNEILRQEYSYDISTNVPKEEIVKLARNHPEFRSSYIKHVENRSSEPYDIEKDEKGLLRWYPETAHYCNKHPQRLPVHSHTDFLQIVELMIREHKNFVEENGGWKLLWNDNGTSKSEKAAQLLFLGIIKHYCKANDIDVSPEPNIGRGPVDFKVSHGYSFRGLLELKLARNTKFWDGLKIQLPTYMEAEGVKHGYFIVVIFSDTDINRLKDIRKVIQGVNSTGLVIQHFTVDARTEKPSASKL
jgi:hypothetical protein